MTGPVAYISTGAMARNAGVLRTLMRRHSSTAALMAVIKSDCYGMGLVPCAEALRRAGVTAYAVSSCDEALTLRQALPQGMILVLGAVDPSEADTLAEHGITLSVVSEEYAHIISRALSRPIDVHIKLDCGMHRIGIDMTDCGGIETAAAMSRLPNLNIAGFFSHLSSADVPKSEQTSAEIALFDHCVAELRRRGIEGCTHLSASSGLLRAGCCRHDYVRCGITLSGYTPSPSLSVPSLTPVLTLTAPVVRVSRTAAGERVGYSGTYTTPCRTTLVTVAMGYGDGLPRSMEGVSFLWQGRRLRQAGRISMEYLTLDAGDCPVREGDTVTIYPPSNEYMWRLAQSADTIPYELLCRIGGRVKRIYTD